MTDRPSDRAIAQAFWNAMIAIPGCRPQSLDTEALLRDAREIDAAAPASKNVDCRLRSIAQAKFESWVYSWHEHPEEADMRLCESNGCYDDEEIQHKFVGFCAGLAAAPEGAQAVAEVIDADWRPAFNLPAPMPPIGTKLYTTPHQPTEAARDREDAEPDGDWRLKGYAYASKQATTCAGCGEHKHTPLRVDWMGGYVCLTCIDKEMERRDPDDLREDAERIASIGELIRTQDNRITDAPIFIVQQKREHVADPDFDHDRIAWVNVDMQEADEEQAAQLEAEFAREYVVPDGWNRLALRTEWAFVTACFTEQGCKDYLARDGHNLREPRIYAAGSYRNEEWRFVRKFLMGCDAARAAGGGGRD